MHYRSHDQHPGGWGLPMGGGVAYRAGLPIWVGVGRPSHRNYNFGASKPGVSGAWGRAPLDPRGSCTVELEFEFST